MKIAIVTAYYYPLNVPRAFRATELAREFARMGHAVTVYNAINVLDTEGNLLSKELTYPNNLLLKNLGVDQWKSCKKGTNNVPFVIKKVFAFFRKITYYFFTNSWMSFYARFNQTLYFDDKYDLLISIGLPFAIHWGVSNKIHGRNVANCYIADYGDPFSKYNKTIKVAKYFSWIEKRAIDKFDYITIPIEKALNSYTWLKERNKIKVIPQGFNFEEIRLGEYSPNEQITFAYAGLFYSDIRNPKSFLNFLCECDFDFRFIIYTDIDVMDSYMCIMPYIEKLGNKIVLKPVIPRLDLIYQLSMMDFLININNAVSNQNPSKLIDYSLAKRPIFSLSQDAFERERFLNFCKHKYDSKDLLDVTPYNIKNVACQFLKLYENICE